MDFFAKPNHEKNIRFNVLILKVKSIFIEPFLFYKYKHIFIRIILHIFDLVYNKTKNIYTSLLLSFFLFIVLSKTNQLQYF